MATLRLGNIHILIYISIQEVTLIKAVKSWFILILSKKAIQNTIVNEILCSFEVGPYCNNLYFHIIT